MKTLLILLLIPIIGFGQNKEIERYVSYKASIDALNIVKGSAPTNYNQEFDVQAGIALHFGNRLTGGFNFESFKAIGYYELSAECGYIFLYADDRLKFEPSLKTGLIFRRGSMVEEYFQYNDKFIGVAVNLKVGYEAFRKLFPNLYFGLQGSLQLRGDLKEVGYKDYIKFNGHILVEYVIYID